MFWKKLICGDLSMYWTHPKRYQSRVYVQCLSRTSKDPGASVNWVEGADLENWPLGADLLDTRCQWLPPQHVNTRRYISTRHKREKTKNFSHPCKMMIHIQRKPIKPHTHSVWRWINNNFTYYRFSLVSLLGFMIMMLLSLWLFAVH